MCDKCIYGMYDVICIEQRGYLESVVFVSWQDSNERERWIYDEVACNWTRREYDEFQVTRVARQK